MKQRLSNLRKELKRAGERQQRETPENRVKRCPAVLDVALKIQILSGGSQVQAARFLKLKFPEEPKVQGLALQQLQTDYDKLTSEERASRLTGSGATSRKRTAEAQHHLDQCALEGWVLEQNAKKGLAPSGPSAWKQLNLLREGQSSQGSGASRPLVTSPAAPGAELPSRPTLSQKPQGRKRWVRRWKKRFGLCRGRFAIGSRLPLEELRQKALRGPHFRTLPVEEIVLPGPDPGPRFVPRFRA